MPGRMTRSAPQSPFELPEVTAVVRATHLSGQNAGKAQKFTPVRGSSGESRVIGFVPDELGSGLSEPAESRDKGRAPDVEVVRPAPVQEVPNNLRAGVSSGVQHGKKARPVVMAGRS